MALGPSRPHNMPTIRKTHIGMELFPVGRQVFRIMWCLDVLPICQDAQTCLIKSMISQTGSLGRNAIYI